jgi:hypothetical protein
MSEIPTPEINGPNDIADPITRTRLVSYQSLISDVNKEYAETEKSIDRKHGMIDAIKVLGDRIFQECERINHQVDKGEVSVDEAKIRVNQVTQIVDLTRQIEELNKKDLVMLRGKLDGFKAVFNVAQKRVDGEVMTYARHLRMEADQAPIREMRAERMKQKENKEPTAKVAKKRGRPKKKS